MFHKYQIFGGFGLDILKISTLIQQINAFLYAMCKEAFGFSLLILIVILVQKYKNILSAITY